MTRVQDLMAVVALALTVDDVTPAEREAVLRVALWVDGQANRQAVTNPLLDPGQWPTKRDVPPPIDPTALLFEIDPILDAQDPEIPTCTYSDDHLARDTDGKWQCKCASDGAAYEPRGGWSRLAQQVTDQWPTN